MLAAAVVAAALAAYLAYGVLEQFGETAEARPDDNDGMVFRHRRRDSTGVRSCETPGNHS